MNAVRRIFVALSIFVMGSSILGVIGFSVAEYLARLELPPEQQTEEAIQRSYDGAVCLGCDFGKIFVLMLGSISSIGLIMLWVVYESVELVLERFYRNRPESH